MTIRSHLLKLGLIALIGAVALLGGRAAHATGPFVEPDAVALYTYASEQAGDGFGWASENLGDINDDGVNDYIISAPFFVSDGAPTGKAYVYSGANGSLLNEVTGNAFDWFGWSVSSAGDVNADGVPDYAVGGRGAPTGPTPNTGRVVVYSGADHSVLYEWIGGAGDTFGYDVNKAGDINGDGYGDVIVGAAFADFTASRAGRVYVFSGANGSVLWTVDGSEADSFLGSAVGFVGDLNGDGAWELTAGAMGAGQPQGHLLSGQAYVFDGATGARIFVLDPLGDGTSSRFGQFFTSDAGDVNADGVPDIFVADYNDGHGGKGAGSAYVFSGVDGSYLHIFHGNIGDGLGPGRGIGDINGDGYADLIIAAYTNSDGAPQAGKTYLFSGADDSVLRTMTGNIPGDFQGVDAVGLGDLNGDGLQDYLITGGASAYVVAGLP